MGFVFPVCYPNHLLPRSLLHALSLIVYIRDFISTLFLCLGLPDFLQPGIDTPVTHHHDSSISASSFPTRCRVPVSHLLICEFLPVVKFSDLVHPPDSCAVCLYDFERRYEIRRLTNCRLVFHQSCLERWMGYDQKSCPLCRTCFFPHDMQDSFNSGTGKPELFGG
ncbi:hypothetical protein Goshw_017926, partial [Gossypium schwendimanii]|nr:hypothetical protein [Gossypium schwendimanii]